MKRFVFSSVLLSGALLSTAANADDCETILKSYEALAATPSYSQTIVSKDSSKMQSVAIGDLLYLNADGTWQKVQLQPGGRLGILKSFVPDAASLKDCTQDGSEELNGKAMTIYSYTPPAIEGMGDAGKSGPQKLWVGNDDGLPYRMVAVNEGIEMTIAYDGVAAPIP
ncbi:hypothetical protein [Pararhizobium sp.]|uniref:hypothetical protein n=1 Tax=Pararhizobium sp. TaxID=1977563 RepID=UPI002723258F|nr:hypothetical protein [Pararhizobium sp.]MDO9416153.1 hypothetical protein [Pararhizobium sp.]